MNSKIEQGIEDIYAFIESCKMQSFSTTKVVVPKNDLYDLLDDLRREVPAELQRYRKMLNQKNAILEKDFFRGMNTWMDYCNNEKHLDYQMASSPLITVNFIRSMTRESSCKHT